MDGIETARRLDLELRFAQGFQASAGDMLFGSAGGTSRTVTLEASSTRTPTTPGALYLRAIRIMLLAARGDRETLATELAAMRRPPPMRTSTRTCGRWSSERSGGRPARWAGGRRAPRHRRRARRVRGSDETFLVAPLLVVGMHAAGDLADTDGRSATPPGGGGETRRRTPACPGPGARGGAGWRATTTPSVAPRSRRRPRRRSAWTGRRTPDCG